MSLTFMGRTPQLRLKFQLSLIGCYTPDRRPGPNADLGFQRMAEPPGISIYLSMHSTLISLPEGGSWIARRAGHLSVTGPCALPEPPARG